jgi:SAM-dependent methyltransferase
MPDPAPLEDWWETLYDDIVADMLLVRKDPQELQATIAFLTYRLGLAPGRVVFDQCCGTGSVAIPLAATGVRVIGVDQCGGYIQRAQQEARSAGATCDFHHADGFEFLPTVACDAAFNWATSFGYADDARNLRMLQRALEALKPGGRFALDYHNVPRLLRRFQECFVQRHTVAAGEVILLRESTLDLPGGRLLQRWSFVLPDGRRTVRNTAVRLYLPHLLAELLSRCGFVDVALHGSVRGEPIGPDSPRCILVARRPGA